MKISHITVESESEIQYIVRELKAVEQSDDEDEPSDEEKIGRINSDDKMDG